MKKNIYLFSMAFSLLTLSSLNHLNAQNVNANVVVDITSAQKNISPFIYGVNNGLNNQVNKTCNIVSRRLGGNRLTSYNWENNASNAGSDYQQTSDNYLAGNFTIPNAQANLPGRLLTTYHDTSLSNNMHSTLTLQMAGYVAKDKNGIVQAGEVAPSARWAATQNIKGAAYSLTPDATDANVYMDELMNFLIQKYGNSNTVQGVKHYELDNEPGLWGDSHPRIHPNKPTCQELITRSTALAKAIKTADPNAIVFGGVFSGWGEYMDFLGATDWNAVRGNTGQFLGWYLSKMKEQSDLAGYRLIDVIDMHYYTEAQNANNGGRVWLSDNSRENAIARMQCTRSLWDSTYRENSWITQYTVQNAPYICLFNRIQRHINNYFPGTKIAVTEYNFGGNNHISGGIAQADFLGLCGKYGIYQTNIWCGIDGHGLQNYNQAAFRIFRNYDGNNSTFGDKFINSSTSNVADVPVYASINSSDNSLHVIVINRNYDYSATVNLKLDHNQNNYSLGSVYSFDKNSSSIVKGTDIVVDANGSATLTIPAQSVMHYVFQYSQTLDVQDEKITTTNYSASAISISPNPCTDYITLNGDVNTDSEIEILDIVGKPVLKISSMPSDKKIDVSCLLSGHYIVKLVTKGQIHSFPLIRNN